MFCIPSATQAKVGPCSWTRKTLIISAAALVISAVVMGVLFGIGNPIANPLHRAFLYADCALGGLALMGVALGGIALEISKKSGQTTKSRQATVKLQPKQQVVSTKNTIDFDLQHVQEEIAKNYEKIEDAKSIPEITYYAGKHMRVIEHANFPGMIIKLPSMQHAKEMHDNIKMCEEVVAKHELKHCMVPHTQVFPLENDKTAETDRALVIMEKVKGIIAAGGSSEASEQAFEQFANQPNLRKKWRAFFENAAEFICLTGYWDTSWNNILLMEDGFGFVDFENIKPTPANGAEGISRLLAWMAPTEFFDTIIQIAKKHGVTEEAICKSARVQDISELKKTRTEQLELHSKVRKWHKTQKIDLTNVQQTFDVNAWPQESCERAILEKFNATVTQKPSNWSKGSVIAQRKLFLQPLADKKFSQEQLSRALINLQKQQVFCTWTVEENSTFRMLDCYNIYF